ncbi:DUF1883 domain-containing protein [Actinosynnema sp. NPDC004786]
MSDYLYWDLGKLDQGTWFRIGLDGSTARVMLVDAGNFSRYRKGREYEFFGGFYDYSPVELEVPYRDRWYLVVDDNDHDVEVDFYEM